jgi:hypothetical protein
MGKCSTIPIFANTAKMTTNFVLTYVTSDLQWDFHFLAPERNKNDFPFIFFGCFPATLLLAPHGWWGMTGLGVYIGCGLTLIWAIGSLVETVEYQEGKTSHWLLWPFNNRQPTRVSSWLPKSINERKLLSASGFLSGIVAGLARKGAEVSLSIFLAVIWIPGVYFVERHFRRHYTRAKK